MRVSNMKIVEVYKNSGTSQTTGKEWHSTELLLSNNDEMFETRMLVRLMPKCAETFNFRKGDVVDIDILHEVREYNSRFYNQISAWRVTPSVF